MLFLSSAWTILPGLFGSSQGVKIHGIPVAIANRLECMSQHLPSNTNPVSDAFRLRFEFLVGVTSGAAHGSHVRDDTHYRMRSR